MEMKIKVGVFFGGKSVEHEISVISAIQAIFEFNKDKYDIVPVYITKQGLMYTGEEVGAIESYRGNISELLEKSTRIVMANENGKINLVRYPSKLFTKPIYDTIDVAFPIVHGTNVEDGALQGYFKSLSCPFVGCDVLSSALGMDKAAQKAVLKQAGIPTLDCTMVSRREFYLSQNDFIEKIEATSAYPVIVKPVNLGSSVGIKKAKDKESLIIALEFAFEFANRAIVEKAVVHLKEINCSVLGDEDGVEASVCEEPINHDEILSYADKYLSGGSKNGAKMAGSKSSQSAGMADTKRKLPADISTELNATIQEYAKKTFLALGCSGVSRIDFLYDTESSELFVNEINTIPGSLSFYLWEATGVSFSVPLDKLVSLAFKRERNLADINFSFDTNILQGVSFGGGSKGKA